MQLLVPLVSAFRYEGDEVNMTLAKSEAKHLHEKISEKCCSDDEIIRILTTRSKAQLNATLNHYNNQFGNAINKVFFSFIKSAISSKVATFFLQSNFPATW